MGMLDVTSQVEGCQKLIAAVVAQAVQDSMMGYVKNYKGELVLHNGKPIFRKHALTAIDFLITKGSWCFHFMDIDQDQFCTRLVHKMFDRKDPGYELPERAAFRLNYQEYLRLHLDKEKFCD